MGSKKSIKQWYSAIEARRQKPRTLEQLHALLMACEAKVAVAWREERELFNSVYASLEAAPGFDYQAILLTPVKNGMLAGFSLRPDSLYGSTRVSMTLVHYKDLGDPQLWQDLSLGPNQKRVEARPQNAMYALALMSRVHMGPAVDAHRAAYQRTLELRHRTGVVRTAIGKALQAHIWRMDENVPEWQRAKLHFLTLGGKTYVWDGRELREQNSFPHLGDCGYVPVNRGTASYMLERRNRQ